MCSFSLFISTALISVSLFTRFSTSSSLVYCYCLALQFPYILLEYPFWPGFSKLPLWILINSSFVLLWIFSSLLHVKLCAKCVGRCVTPLQNHLALHLTKHVQISSWKASLSISWQDIKWAEEIFQLGFIHYWMLITIFLCWISVNMFCSTWQK